MITRRAFLIGSCASFTLTFFDKFFTYIENHGEPLIEAPDWPEDDLFVYPNRGYKFGLNGDPDELEFPYESWLEYLMDAKGIQRPTKMSHYREIFRNWNVQPSELAEPVPLERAIAYMERTGPGADAHDLLKDLNIGPDLGMNKGEVGGLTFYSTPTPIENYYGVAADNAISLSILQHRLNELGQDIGIVLASG